MSSSPRRRLWKQRRAGSPKVGKLSAHGLLLRMSRIPVVTSTPSTPVRASSPSPFQPSPAMSNLGRPSPSTSRRPESVYSASNLSTTSSAPGLTEGNLAETRKRQSRRDEVSPPRPCPAPCAVPFLRRSSRTRRAPGGLWLNIARS